MPTYQYECTACQHQFEIFQSMLEEKLKKCPECKQNRLTRLIGTGTGIIFKGTGFFETDYKRKAPVQKKTKEETSAAAAKADPASKGAENP